MYITYNIVLYTSNISTCNTVSYYSYCIGYTSNEWSTRVIPLKKYQEEKLLEGIHSIL